MTRPEIVVYIATSIDGFIARPDGGLDWLEHDTHGEDYGFAAFMASVGTLLMGRATYEMVQSFDGPWPYGEVPVVVLSRSLSPADLKPKPGAVVSLDAGTPAELVDRLAAKGVARVYLDGGRAVQRFLAADAVDTLIISRIPVLLGDGVPLFGPLPGDLRWQVESSTAFRSGVVQTTYRRQSKA